jgi:hypothetical protein
VQTKSSRSSDGHPGPRSRSVFGSFPSILTVPSVRLRDSENKQKCYATNEDTGSIRMQQFRLRWSKYRVDYIPETRSYDCRKQGPVYRTSVDPEKQIEAEDSFRVLDHVHGSNPNDATLNNNFLSKAM